MRKPNLFIVGAPKCGTTSLYTWLGEHQDVFMSPVKEPHHFARDLDYRDGWAIEDKDEYLALFDSANNEKYIGEASVWHLYSECAADLIKEFNPEAKIIAIVRDPTDASYSLWWFNLTTGSEKYADFEAALNAEPKRKEGFDIPPEAPFPDCLFYTEMPRYAAQIGRYIDNFGQSNVHVVILEELARNRVKVERELLQFLGLSETGTDGIPKSNTAYLKENLWYRRLRRRYPALSEIIPSLVSERIRSNVKNLLNGTSSSQKRPPLSDHLRERLETEFDGELRAVENLTERSLS
jgi:hypothetical protein